VPHDLPTSLPSRVWATQMRRPVLVVEVEGGFTAVVVVLADAVRGHCGAEGLCNAREIGA